jgi:hypothetical protein
MPLTASAHGIHAHIHVTGWAIESLPDGELRDFFQDPEVMNAALFGAAFTDSGYWPLSGEMGEIARAYSEHTHWEPFIQDVVSWMRDNDPPPWTSLESRKRAAFFMGCASHGMQDELFDSLFLHQVHAHDGGDQDGADPASDGFLILDGHLRFYPQPYMPMETLLTLYEALDVEVTEVIIEAAVDKMLSVYVNDDFGPELARTIGESSKETLPWTYDHYMDETIPGSLRSEIAPTAGYIQAIWARFHGTFDPNHVVVGTYPAPGLRLLGIDADSPDSWVTFVYGAGVEREGPAHAWMIDAGAPVPFQREGTRWGASWTRLHSLRPSQDLPHGTWTTATLPHGSALIDATRTTIAYDHLFQTPCEAEGDPLCQPAPDDTPRDAAGTGAEASGEDTAQGGAPSGPGAAADDEGCHGGSTSGDLALLTLLAWLALRRRDATIATR